MKIELEISKEESQIIVAILSSVLVSSHNIVVERACRHIENQIKKQVREHDGEYHK